MIDPVHFIRDLKGAGIEFITGVPDSLLKDFCDCIAVEFNPEQHVPATNEGAAIGLAIGHFLAKASPALVYMQNSGLGNALNPLVSLCDPAVCGFPLILLIGWRGELCEDQTQLSDEPQHVKQGRITQAQLDLLGIPTWIIESSSKNTHLIFQQALETALCRPGPVALLVRKSTFSPFESRVELYERHELTREEAIREVLLTIPSDVPVISTTGMASRELFELRRHLQNGHQRDFLTVGGMGHASQIASGICISRPDKKVVCIDGDGAVLMHSGSLAVSADCPNLIHIVINNGAHDSVGGQPTKGKNLRFDQLASAFGYKVTALAADKTRLRAELERMVNSTGSSLLEILCRRGARKDLMRPDRSPSKNKADFIAFLREQRDG